MIAKYYGKFYSLQSLRDKHGVSKEGVSFEDISHAAETIGLRSLSLKCTVDDLLFKIPLPAIIHWDNSHFVVVYKISSSSTLYVSDPAKGHVKYTAKKFAAKWVKQDTSKGLLMAMEPQSDFYERQGEEKIERRKTFENFLGYFKPYKKSFINLFIVMLLVTILQGLLPFISKAVIDVGIQTHDIDFINIVLGANVAIKHSRNSPC